MQALPDRINPAALGRLRLRLSGVLRPAGAQHVPQQDPSRGDAGRHQPLSWRPESNRNLGLRQAEIGETPLSIEEVTHGRRIGEIL